MPNSTVWFITGASKGLGAAMVTTLLERGHRVAATSRDQKGLESVFGPASERFLPLELDLGSEPDAARAVLNAREHFGGLDVVVNNAGYGQFGAVEEVTDGEARRCFEVNVFGVLNVLRAALPVLRGQGRGHVFNIASVGGFVGTFPGAGIYCGTKFALAGITESLHAELAPLGVKVTLVYPGYFRTAFLSQGSMGRPARPIAAYGAAKDLIDHHASALDGAQPGDPAKLAEALITASEMEAPMLHLFLGADAVGFAEDKLASLRREVDAHRAVSVGTDHT